ncbi:MAG: hypothetical protein RQ752_13945 [Thermohalobaculum sp.]|nr:hypothetical protein [Thermohalobaculum sp.]
MLRSSRLGAALMLAWLVGACQSSDLTPEADRIVGTGQDIVDRGALPLTAAEIRIYLADATLSHAGARRVWHVYLGADGTLTGLALADDGGSERNRGAWSVREDGGSGLICRQWQQDWAEGASGCATVYRFGADFVFVPEGSGQTPADDIRRTRSPGDRYKVL